ncbi:MAG: TIGR00730 family Rossman fold protein [Sphingobacteriales bacterium]|jgi:uncharacterized protein (TIGR00730 family)|nr:TIGR00730 family Rossman fold protein [Sphingobacteriales bacterium]MBP9140314.1 TIGR00730 family Rossman fold protein [Chitinophagales bacterium]MDA0197159.1 TIGR00730 family Rossman fold protein [Bacteroidota bacterium]MBK6891404.1 TIGR00730 family Rossman fold protein [Sphingobacteriales bacterium]MBK7526764.1 TIGR00730 family Rossman fold protein [Sphingobacteriales bacterium]
MKAKKLCVFCGSRVGNDPIYAQSALDLAQLMVQNNFSLVYGGGSVGIMGVMANYLMENNGEVIGVIPHFLMDQEVGKIDITQLILTNTMHERKAQMAEIADAFAILPGSIGTMDEFFEILTWRQLGLHQKPIVLLNVNGYYNSLQNLIQQFCQFDFIDKSVLQYIHFTNTPNELIEYLLLLRQTH